MKKLTIGKIKDILVILLPFLTICGCLYNIAYWDRFGLNGLEYVDLSDIVKSSIYPLLSFGGFYIFIYSLFSSRILIDDEEMKEGCLFKIIGLSYTLGLCWLYTKCSNSNWFFWGLFASILPPLYLYSKGFLKADIQNDATRLNVIYSIVVTIALSFCAGKYESDRIYFNKEFKYVVVKNTTTTNQINKNDTVKYLGIAKDKFFFIDLKNSKIFILNKADTLVLMRH